MSICIHKPIFGYITKCWCEDLVWVNWFKLEIHWVSPDIVDAFADDIKNKTKRKVVHACPRHDMTRAWDSKVKTTNMCRKTNSLWNCPFKLLGQHNWKSSLWSRLVLWSSSHGPLWWIGRQCWCMLWGIILMLSSRTLHWKMCTCSCTNSLSHSTQHTLENHVWNPRLWKYI